MNPLRDLLPGFGAYGPETADPDTVASIDAEMDASNSRLSSPVSEDRRGGEPASDRAGLA